MKKFDDSFKKLVIARLDVLPPNRKISIGAYGSFSKDELIERINRDDEVGQKIIEIEMNFLQSLKKGLLVN